MVKEAQSTDSFSQGFASELDSMCCVLKEKEIDPLLHRGRKLMWRAWRQFERLGFDFEKWKDCDRCRAEYMPVRNRDMVDAFIDAFVKKRKDQRKRDRRFYYCADCGGLPSMKILRPGSDDDAKHSFVDGPAVAIHGGIPPSVRWKLVSIFNAQQD